MRYLEEVASSILQSGVAEVSLGSALGKLKRKVKPLFSQDGQKARGWSGFYPQFSVEVSFQKQKPP